MSRFDRLFFASAEDPIAGETAEPFATWLERMRAELADPGLQAVIVWPTQSARGRLYVHLIEHSGRQRGFAKISFDDVNDEWLRTEASMLATLRAADLQQTIQPRVLAEGAFAGHGYLLLESIPERGAPVQRSWPALQQIVADYAGPARVMTASEIRALSWWRRFEVAAHCCPAFAEQVRTAMERSITVCRVHGDFGCHNLLEADGRLWLYDWEHSSDAGPILTDLVRFWTGEHQQTLLHRTEAGLRAFQERFFAGGAPEPAHDVIMALAYLHANEISEATRLVEAWKTVAPK